jgi:hypothetical protein
MITMMLGYNAGRWFREPAVKQLVEPLKLWWKHLSAQHPLLADGLEWTGSGGIALSLLLGTLIANDLVFLTLKLTAFGRSFVLSPQNS